MGDHEHRLAPRLPDAQQFPVHALAGQRIQRAKGLVQQQHLGVMDQGTRQGHPLAHAAREVAGQGGGEILQADQVQHLASVLLGHVGGHALDFQRQGDVAQRRTPGHQVGVLKDKANLASWAGEGLAVKEHPPASRAHQARQDAQQGRLAAPRRADDRHELVGRQGKVGLGQRLKGAVGRGKGHLYVLGSQH